MAQQVALHPRVTALQHAHTPSPHKIGRCFRRQPYDGGAIDRHCFSLVSLVVYIKTKLPFILSSRFKMMPRRFRKKLYCILAQNVGTSKHRLRRLRMLIVYCVSKMRVKSGWHSINDLEITMRVATSTQNIMNVGRNECFLFFAKRNID